MKKLTISFLVLIVLNALAIETKACHKDGKDHKDKYFGYIDANKDGKLTQGEMVDHSTKMFKEQDKNKDGFVDKDELRAHFQAKHKDSCKSK